MLLLNGKCMICGVASRQLVSRIEDGVRKYGIVCKECIKKRKEEKEKK